MSKGEEDGGLSASEEEATSNANDMDPGSIGDEDGEITIDDITQALGLDPEDDETDATEEDEESSEGEEDSDEGDSEGSEDIEAEAEEEETEEDDSKDEEAEEDDEVDDAVQQRIDALTQGKKQAEETAAALQQQVQQQASQIAELQAKANARPAQSAGPFDDVNDVQSLIDKRNELAARKQWAFERLDGTTIKDSEGNEHEFTAERMRRFYNDIDRQLTIDLPAREQYLSQRSGYDSEAQRVYPDMFKGGTEFNRRYHSALAQYPSLRDAPEAALIIGDQQVGAQVRLGRFKLVHVKQEEASAEGKKLSKKSAKKAVSSKTRTQKPVRRNKAPVARRGRESGASRKSQNAESSFMSGDGSEDSLVDFLEASGVS